MAKKGQIYTIYSSEFLSKLWGSLHNAWCFFYANFKDWQTVLFLLHKRGDGMTTIELFTDDQKLYFTRKVYIASGDVESVQLHVDFCGAWDGFPVRTATFTNDTSKVSADAVMTDNQCTVPFEVLAKSGTLYVSIVGDSADGSKRKTSGRIKYRVDVGAELSGITLTPTKDVYQQFLSAIHDMEDPITQEMKASIEATMAEECEKIKSEAVKSALSYCVKPCDFSSKIHEIQVTGSTSTTWTATQDCWLSVNARAQSSGYYAKAMVNGIQALYFSSGSAFEIALPPLYIKKGDVIECATNIFTGGNNFVFFSIYACAE